MTANVAGGEVAGLLAFADTADIDDFVAGLQRYERGEMPPDEFRAFRLARGTYGQRQPDVSMLRVKIPLGVMTAAQLRAVADVAERWSRGFGHVTTRQNFQLHMVKMVDVEAAQRHLAETGLTTREACGNTVRNVTGCPMAGVGVHEPFDVTAVGQAIARHFLRKPENQRLPRKFKIAVSCCPHDCAKGAINDVGLIAKMKDGQPGFMMNVAGGLSTSPEAAHTLHEWLPVDEVIPWIEATLDVFDRMGNRQNRARARLKFVLRKMGWEAFSGELHRVRDAARAAGRGPEPIDLTAAAALARSPSLPLAFSRQTTPEETQALAAFRKTNVVAQRQAGFVAVTLRLRRGDITAAQMRALADLAVKHADGTIRLTVDQNLLLRFVSQSRLVEVWRELVAIGIADAGASTIADVTSCPGADTCNLAVTGSRELATALSAALEGDPKRADAIDRGKDLDIKISGCPNSCGQHHIAAIGFHGAVRRVGGKAVPEYMLHLGGGVDADGAQFGRQGVRVPARRAPEALLRIVALIDREKLAGERAVTTLRRLEIDAIKEALGDVLVVTEQSLAAEEYLDVGTDQPFAVHTGEGECAA